MEPTTSGTFTFDRGRRLRKRREFTRVQSGGLRWSGRYFVFLYSVRPESERSLPSRLGLVVSRRVGCAVVRNRIKRLCREVFRLAPVPFPSGVDLVVIVKSEAGTASRVALRAEWAQATRPLWQRARETLARASAAAQGGTAAARPERPQTARPPP